MVQHEQECAEYVERMAQREWRYQRESQIKEFFLCQQTPSDFTAEL